jgi:SOS-response transcriptional repressor LexA
MTSLESVTATVRARSESAKATGADESDGRPCFKKLPAMSASAFEEFLGLPPGAWKRRRLFALRTMTDAHAEAGIPKGAQIVVEPGARTAPGRLVLVKDSDGMTIRRVDYDRNGRTVMRPAATGQLPFPSEGTRKQVVGTIIGVLPRVRVAGRTISSGRRPPKAPTSPPALKEKTVAPADHAKASAILRRDMEIWAGTRNESTTRPTKGAQVRWRALAARLRVLASCLEVAHQTTLYAALAEEANRIISAMRRELDRYRTPDREELELLPPPIDQQKIAYRPESGDPTGPPPNAAKRHCTDPPAPPLDMAPAGML